MLLVLVYANIVAAKIRLPLSSVGGPESDGWSAGVDSLLAALGHNARDRQATAAQAHAPISVDGDLAKVALH
jgi:hypothetical protein